MTLTLWLTNQDELQSLEIDSAASIQDLYQQTSEEYPGTRFTLSFAGNQIEKGQGSLADAGLCNEAVIDIHFEMPIWQSLQQTFGNMLVKREQVEWWIAAEQCRFGINITSCSDEAVCRDPIWTNYGFVYCNTEHEITAIIVNRYTPFQLNGTLNMEHFPRTVQAMSISGQYIPTVDFQGLSNDKAVKALEYLVLDRNQITAVHNLNKVKESSLEELNLSFNEISGVFRVADWVGPHSKLLHLDLDSNKFNAIKFENNWTHCSLEVLSIAGNPIESMDFEGIATCNLLDLEVRLRVADRHLLTNVSWISVLKSAEIDCGGAYDYLMEHHRHVHGVTEHIRMELPMFVVFLLLFARLVLRAQ